jgi:hypothetical protein
MAMIGTRLLSGLLATVLIVLGAGCRDRASSNGASGAAPQAEPGSGKSGSPPANSKGTKASGDAGTDTAKPSPAEVQEQILEQLRQSNDYRGAVAALENTSLSILAVSQIRNASVRRAAESHDFSFLQEEMKEVGPGDLRMQLINTYFQIGVTPENVREQIPILAKMDRPEEFDKAASAFANTMSKADLDWMRSNGYESLVPRLLAVDRKRNQPRLQ